MTSEGIETARWSLEKPLSIAILAMGGQGGGVLADWIVETAEREGWFAQSTSVPGVAQRTGATIYYIEMLPAGAKPPVLALMPTPGDVDIVLAAEFMEAGRSMLRGLVTPDRTTLITSTHRAFAVSEKEKPGDGIGDPATVVAAAGIAARRTIAFDMQAVAERSGSVISAALFGALAAADVLPFARQAFETTIRAGGRGIEASLRAFSLAYDQTEAGPPPVAPVLEAKPELLPRTGHAVLDALVVRIAEFPASTQPMLLAGVKRVVDFQDPAYAGQYIDELARLRQLDAQAGSGKDFAFTREAAKYLAVAMSYDDVIRVADLKTRRTRFERVRNEVGARRDQLVYTTEFMHPRMAEVTGAMPAALGQFIESRPGLFNAFDRIVNRGRRVRTGTIFWFMTLYAVSAMKPIRRITLRHQRETAHIKNWLDIAVAVLPKDYDLAVEIIMTRRLVKGYSDTHARGESKFDRVIAAVPMLIGKPDGAAWLRRLRQAALADEQGDALNGALKTVASVYG